MGNDARIIYLPGALVKHFVPDKRIQTDYLARMARGVGMSEVTRMKSLKGSLYRIYLNELFKWMATFLLFFIYLVKLEYSRGRMLVFFRFHVTKGLLSRNKDDHQNSVFS